MSKKFLDEIIGSNKKQSLEQEDEFLQPLIDEINLINNEDIKSFVRSVLIKASSFWEVPSSFSGKYHPPDEHGIGGNVLHTKRVVRVASVIASSYVLSDEEFDVVVASCLLHDITKGIKSNSEESFHYDPMHPYTVQSFIEKCIEHDKQFGDDSCSTTLFIQEEAIQTIMRLVRCHLGPWSPVPETYPITYLDYIVHLADNVSSKIHVFIEDSELINDIYRKNEGSKNSK